MKRNIIKQALTSTFISWVSYNRYFLSGGILLVWWGTGSSRKVKMSKLTFMSWRYEHYFILIRATNSVMYVYICWEQMHVLKVRQRILFCGGRGRWALAINWCFSGNFCKHFRLKLTSWIKIIIIMLWPLLGCSNCLVYISDHKLTNIFWFTISQMTA